MDKELKIIVKVEKDPLYESIHGIIKEFVFSHGDWRLVRESLHTSFELSELVDELAKETRDFLKRRLDND